MRDNIVLVIIMAMLALVAFSMSYTIHLQIMLNEVLSEYIKILAGMHT